MAVNRCRNLLNVFHQRSVLSTHGTNCLLVNYLTRAHAATDGKNTGSEPPPTSTSGTTTPTLTPPGPVPGQKEEEEHKQYEENIRNKILKASLPFVHNYGWSKDALSAGAESLGYPGIVHGMFPRGGAELIQYFYVSSNQQLVELLKLFVAEVPSAQPIDATTSSRKGKDPKLVISYAVENRLKMIEPYLSHWPQALAIMTLPPNVPTSLANLLTLVDDIWYYAGDRSVDFNWYSRRIALAGIYKMTELYMIQDGSANHQNTWIFLNKRLEEATQIHSFFEQGESATQFAKDIAAATFITARNILGLNWNR